MKKLIIAACAVALVGAVQAATYSWNVSTSDVVYDGYKNTSVGSYGNNARSVGGGLNWMLIYANAEGGLTQAQALTALRGDGIDSKYVLTSGKTSSAEGSAGKILASEDGFKTDVSLVDSSNMLSAFLIVDNGKGNVYISSTSSVEANTEGGISPFSIGTATSKFQRDITGDTAFGSAGWYQAAAVPEPTSGLLLLLGVAGLALRRRRA